MELNHPYSLTFFLLIVPKGIEIYEQQLCPHLQNVLLIVPKGIEITKLNYTNPAFNSFNCTERN